MTNQAMLSIFDYLCNEARNSVHGLFGLVEMRGETASDSAWRNYMEGSRLSTDRMLRSIDDVRELLSTESPTCQNLEEFDAALCLGETIDLLNLASNKPSNRIILDAPREALVVRQDRLVVEQVLARVLDSASKGRRSGDIRATATAEGGGVRIEIGLPNLDVMAWLAAWLGTEPDRAVFQSHDDVALGVSLMVAARRLRSLGGSAGLKSDPPALTALAIHVPSQAASPSAVSAEPWQQSDSAEALNVLVAEDCDESFAISELLLKKENVWRARGGLEAVDMVKARRFDVVLMDVHMPGMNGYEVIRVLRDWETQTGNARTPIVIASSDDLEKQQRSAAQAGCSGFLRKPLRKSDLVDLLERFKAARAIAA